MSKCKICDRCYKKINRYEGYNLKLTDNLLGMAMSDFDLCKICKKKFDEFMENNEVAENE